MKIIICGAGLSGRAIAEKLSQIGNEVTIIDSSKRLIEKLGNKIDIKIKEDKDLIGGVIIQAGDSVVDASLRGRLKELNNIIAQ